MTEHEFKMETAKQRYLKRTFKQYLAGYMESADGIAEPEAKLRVQNMEAQFLETFEANLAENQKAAGMYLERMTEI